MLLPQSLRRELRQLTYSERAAAEELRLRTGMPVTVVLPEEERTLSSVPVTGEHIDGVISIATRVSAHTCRESMRSGYITAEGGFRIGLAGTVIMKNGEPDGFRELSSIAIRVARELKGISDPVFKMLPEKICSTLILSPPGCGKTTLLRDMVRRLSDDGHRIALCDERSEIAASCQMDVGAHTDVMDGCPKSQAVMMMLRAMNPQIIAIDEITRPEDIQAIKEAANCGVMLIATAHAWDEDDLSMRPMYRKLLAQRIFKHVVVISKENGERKYEVKTLC
jgi:stage III sporulation protein AA